MDHGWDRETPIFNALLREWRGHHRSVPAIEPGPPVPGALPAAGRSRADRVGGERVGGEPPISALTRLLPPTAPGAGAGAPAGAGQTGHFRIDGRPAQGGSAGQGGQGGQPAQGAHGGQRGPGGGHPAPPARPAPHPPGAPGAPPAPGAPGSSGPGNPEGPGGGPDGSGDPRDNALHRLLHPPRRP